MSITPLQLKDDIYYDTTIPTVDKMMLLRVLKALVKRTNMSSFEDVIKNHRQLCSDMWDDLGKLSYAQAECALVRLYNREKVKQAYPELVTPFLIEKEDALSDIEADTVTEKCRPVIDDKSASSDISEGCHCQSNCGCQDNCRSVSRDSECTLRQDDKTMLWLQYATLGFGVANTCLLLYKLYR